MAIMASTSASPIPTPDDATAVHAPSLSPSVVPEAQATGGADGPVPTSTKPGEAPSAGLTDQTNFLPARQVITVFMGLSVAIMCSFLDQTIVATALPRIASDLHSGKESAWVATAYLLTSLAFTPLYGRWSDVFGRKQVLIVSLFIFWTFSLACALARTMLQLIIFRAFQGIGGGAIITMTLIIISDIVSLQDRGKFQGINEGVIAISNGVGPLLGGVFSEYTTWRWAFWINLPLAGIAIAVSTWILPLRAVQGNPWEKLRKIDYVGSMLTIVASVLLLLGLNYGGVTYPWTSAHVLVPLILGVVLFAVFVYWEARHAALPIVPIHLFRIKTVIGVYISTMMSGMTFFVVMYYIPQFIQLVRGSSAVTSSVLVLPFLAPVAIFVALAGQYVSRTGRYRWLIIMGYSMWAVSQGLQTTITAQTSNARIAGTLLIGGVGAGFTFQTSILAAQAAVPRHEMAVVTGVRNFVRLLGSTLALAIAGALVNNALRSALRPLGLTAEQVDALLDDPTVINSPTFLHTISADQRAAIIAGYTRGFHHVFYLTVACVCVAWLSGVFLIGHHDLKRADDEKLKEESKQRLAERKLKGKEGAGVDVEKGQESRRVSNEHADEKVDEKVDEDAEKS